MGRRDRKHASVPVCRALAGEVLMGDSIPMCALEKGHAEAEHWDPVKRVSFVLNAEGTDRVSVIGQPQAADYWAATDRRLRLGPPSGESEAYAVGEYLAAYRGRDNPLKAMAARLAAKQVTYPPSDTAVMDELRYKTRKAGRHGDEVPDAVLHEGYKNPQMRGVHFEKVLALLWPVIRRAVTDEITRYMDSALRNVLAQNPDMNQEEEAVVRWTWMTAIDHVRKRR